MDSASHTAELRWLCLRSHPRQEHLAVAHLRKAEEIEVFFPRLRFKKATRRGAQWFTEALFPNYLFARFDTKKHLSRVKHTPGVSTVVQFGKTCAVVPDFVILELKKSLGEEELKVLPDQIDPGDIVVVTNGLFKGLHATVTDILPSKERVKILLNLLGRLNEVEIERVAVVPYKGHPLAA